MKKTSYNRIIVRAAAVAVLAASAGQAFPPAPHHKIYGTVRDSKGNPLSESATVVIKGTDGELLRSSVDATVAPGANYALKVPMDSGTLNQLYRPTALKPTMPFTINVDIGGISYLPIEIKGPAEIGEPAASTRLDLTLGVDSDGDGLPDAWEQDVLNSDLNDAYTSLGDIHPGDDLDRDGISNLSEYIAGTYAFDWNDGLKLEILEIEQGIAHLSFLSISGRTYTVQISSDGETFTPVSFATSPRADQIPSYRAAGVATQNIFVPIAGETRNQLFRLHVE